MHNNGEAVMQELRLKTRPLAIKMLKAQDETPAETIRPVKSMGKHLDLCYGFSRIRWEGKTMAFLKGDMWCFEPMVGYGLAELFAPFLEGHSRYPATAKTLEAGSNLAKSAPRLDAGIYVGIVPAPLTQCGFEPEASRVLSVTELAWQLLLHSLKRSIGYKILRNTWRINFSYAG